MPVALYATFRSKKSTNASLGTLQLKSNILSLSLSLSSLSMWLQSNHASVRITTWMSRVRLRRGLYQRLRAWRTGVTCLDQRLCIKRRVSDHLTLRDLRHMPVPYRQDSPQPFTGSPCIRMSKTKLPLRQWSLLLVGSISYVTLTGQSGVRDEGYQSHRHDFIGLCYFLR